MLVATETMSEGDQPAISMLGTRAILFEASGAFTMTLQQRIWALAEACGQRDDVEEAVPGVTNLLVIFTGAPARPEAIRAWLTESWSTLPGRMIEGRLFEIGVRYGGALGNDLRHVAEHAGLSPEAVIARHHAPEYTVCAIGSAPGFGYLHGLDPTIATPRKAVPTLRMEAGTVIIGGMQTGISALTGPNGWHSIGFAEVALFDPLRDPPTLFMIGDRIRFVPESIEI
ncbi:5-oxoprolinase subunit PxpB [Sphingomonadaceae bacterium OTU29MARTA1]|nr:5-oxoprolinase subunit PxpB [Sphingomonadaceae bacterium OTU29MARTA1]